MGMGSDVCIRFDCILYTVSVRLSLAPRTDRWDLLYLCGVYPLYHYLTGGLILAVKVKRLVQAALGRRDIISIEGAVPRNPSPFF